MKTSGNAAAKIQLLILTWLISSSALLAQGERIIWSKQDYDPYVNVAFSHSGAMVALGREDSNTADFLDARNGNLIRSFYGSHNRINDSVFTLDDQYLIDGNGGGGETLTLNLWRVSDGLRLLRLGAHTNGTHSVSLTRDGQYVVTSGRFARELKVWHVPDLSLVITIPNNDPESPTLPPRVKDSEFSPDGQLIGSGDLYGLKVRRAATGELVRRIRDVEIVSVAFSPDGTLIAGAVESQRVIKIWRVSDGNLVRTLAIASEFQFPRIAFSPNGGLIAAGYGSSNTTGAIQFWSVSTGRTIALYAKPNHVHSIAFSPTPGVYGYTEYGGRVTVASLPIPAEPANL